MYIMSLKVKGYRSLKDINLRSLGKFVVFYGENNAGKSNILSVLRDIFRAKYMADTFNAETQKSTYRPVSFHKGMLLDFHDNFYNNKNDPIQIEVKLSLNRQERNTILNGFNVSYNSIPQQSTVYIHGVFTWISNEKTEFTADCIKWQRKMIYEEKGGKINILTGLDNLNDDQCHIIRDRLLAYLTNSFVLISFNRFLKDGEEENKDAQVTCDSYQFKNWLFKLSLDKNNQNLFKELNDKFSKPPFNYGKILFARIGNNIEIIVDNERSCLPVNRIGTGVHQALFLLAKIISNKHKMFGIEEIEMNLSPHSQGRLTNTLDQFIRSNDSPINQLLATTHSKKIGFTGKHNAFYVEHNTSETLVEPYSRVSHKAHFA